MRVGAVALTSRRAHGRHRPHPLSRHLSRRLSHSPRLSPSSIGNHHNRSGRLRRRNRHRPRRTPSRSRSRRHPLRIGSPFPRTENGYPPACRGATGLRRPYPIRGNRCRRPRTGPPANTSASDGHPNQPCSRLPNPVAAATPRRRRLPSRGACPRHRRWPPNPRVLRRTPNLRCLRNRHQRSRRRDGTAASRTPAGSRLPTCWRGCRRPRPAAAVAGAARSELGS
jgi:hypothetical protein